MALFSGLVTNCSGVLHHPMCQKPVFRNRRSKTELNGNTSVPKLSGKIVKSGIWPYLTARHCVIRAAAASSGGNNTSSNFDNDYVWEPFWISSIKELYSDLRSLLVFLIEQPGQLKYIEWPRFQSTLKTATLTLVLVAMFIVALSSVDSALAYILAWFLRKSQ